MRHPCQKVVFVGPLAAVSASGRQRQWAIEACVDTVEAVDTNAYARRPQRVFGLIARGRRDPRLLSQTAALRDRIRETCDRLQPDLVWFEWPRTIDPALLEELRARPYRPFLISFQDDNPFGHRIEHQWQWREYLRCVPHFDLHLVKRPSDIARLHALGARACRLWEHGIYRPLFHPASPVVEKQYDLSFIGTCMDQRAHLIGQLLEAGLKVDVFGNQWDTKSRLPARYPGRFHGAVEGEAYADVIRRSRICLGLVSHSNQDEWTMRTYEVPGCGTMLLAEDTPTHRRLFEDGREAVLFRTPQECVECAREVLNTPGRAEAIGAAGHEKCVREGWFLEHRARELFDEFDESSTPTWSLPKETAKATVI